jgi:hypothetical protein
MVIEPLSDWYDILHLLHDAGYTLWQMQYGIDAPEGFQARFIAPGRPTLEIVTHAQDVRDAILGYRPE